MIIILLYLLLQLIYCQVYNLEDNFICQGVLCNIGDYTTNVYNYGVESFGDLTGQQFQLSFHIQIASVPEEQYIFSIMQGSNSYMSIVAMYGSPTQVEFTINTNQTFYINTANWYQVILNNTHVSICDYKQCINLAIQFTLPLMPRFNFFLQDSTNYWRGIGYGITLYKGFSSLTAYLLQNMLQPETILDINIQELRQHNITVDYSQYELVNKLGQKFNWDIYDPYLIENSLLFNSSQFIYIKDPNLKRETYSIEFRLEQSQIFSSSITLFNYTYLNNYQLLIFLNGTQSIGVKLNGQTIQYPLIQNQVIHICIGVIHNLELNLKYFQLCFIQLSNTGVLQLIEPTIFTYYTSSSVFKSGNGDLFIGSLQNQFSSGQYIKLFHMRIYLGFFFDDQGIIDPLCKFYLNDRCILCIGGYVLTLEHNCKLECTSSSLLTWLVQSHNQCLRLCSPICSTCFPSDPLVCLQCNGIRIQPPQCKCPAGYFEDGVSPNCRKYFPEMQTQIGFIQTWYDNTNDIYTPIVFDRPYMSNPTVALFYTGYKSVNKTIQHLHSDTLSISLTGFTAKTRFSEAEYFQVYWMSSIGNYKFIPQTSVWYPTLTNQNYTITVPTLKNNVPFVTFPHMQDFNNNITTAVNGEFKLQITKATNTIYNVKSTGYYLRLNFIQNNFVSYLFDSPNHTAVVSLGNIPKSVQSLVIINGLISPVRLGFQLRQKKRNSTTYQFFNTHKITNFNGNVLFLAQQCYNTVEPCDFYTSYITSCSMQYSFCNCFEDGHYLNSTNECDQCSLNCGNCVGTKTNCTSCNPSQFKTFVSNNCICTGKRFLDASSNICKSCDFRCLTCNGALMTNCLTCHPDQSLAPQKECVCPSRKYFDQILLNCICIYFLITDCLDRQYVDNTLSICVDCQYSCSTCDRGDKCLTCPTSRQMIGTNQCICKNGYYENYNLECLRCKQECDTCENFQNCTSCIDTQKVLIDGSCFCPDGFFDNPQSFVCQQCQFPCVKCIGLQICTQCQHDMILINQKCICPLDMYLSQNNICGLCSPSCDTCFGSNTNQCKSCGLNSYLSQNNECFCKSGYFNNNNLCTKCHSSCTECVDDSHCLSCSFNRYFDTISNSCICQQGYYESVEFYCISCDSQCKACSSSDSCLECWPNQILSEGKCVCNQGFYLESNTCLSCNDELAKFNDQCKVLDCSDGVWSPFEECDDGNQIYRDGCSQCLIDPQYQCVNVVRQKSFCFQCQENCLYCDQSQCQECYQGYFLYKNNCIRCSQQCQTCINTPTQCLKCAISDQIPDQNYHCKGCSIGYRLQNNQCTSKCGDGIKTPEEECDDGNLLEGDGCNKSCQIEPKHYCYQDNQQSICQTSELDIFLKIHPLSFDSYFLQIESSEMIQFTNLELQIKSDHNNNQEIFTSNSTYQSISQQLQLLQINCTIKFQQSVDQIVLKFIINGNIQNRMKQPLHVNPLNQSFQNILCMTAEEKEITESMIKQASYQIKGTILLLILRILIFGIAQSSRMVRVNNIVSFIKYIDIQIPPNYMEFLIELEGLNLINNLYITQLIDMTNLLPQELFEYIEPGRELNQFQNNKSFIINVLPFVINLFACYVLIRYLQLQTFAIKMLIQKRYHQNVRSINSTFYKILVWLEIYSRKLYVETNSQGYQELYLAFEYNICFFISLQLIGLNVSSKYDFINLTLAVGFLIHFIRQLYLRLKNKQIQHGNRAFNIIMVVDPCFYTVCIVFLNNFPLCQLLIIQICQIIMILSLIRQPLQQSQYNYQILIEEIFLLLTFKSFLIFIYFPIELDYTLIGFVQMGFLSLIFTANSCIQIYELIQKLKQLYSKHERKLQKQKDKYKRNPIQLIQLQQ